MQDFGIPEIPEIVLGFFVSQGIPEKPENAMGFLQPSLSIFEIDNFDILLT